MTETDPLTALLRMTFAFTPTAVRAAATLRLPDLVEAGTTGLADLAEQSGCERDPLGRLLRYLCLIGLFTEDGPERYALTDVGRGLLSDHPAGLRRWLDLDSDARRIEARMEGAMGHLLTAVRTGEPVYEKAYGCTFWDDLAADKELARSFDDSLAVHAGDLAREVAGSYDWGSVGHVVDVGGGTGALLAELLGRHSGLRGTLLDMDSVVVNAPEVLAPVADRAEIVGGSFFDALPTGADVYLIANTVHNWADDDAVRILRRCAEAAPGHGRVVLAERLLDAKDPLLASYADLLMLVLLGAKERTVDDFRALGAKAGLHLAETTRLEHPGLWLLEFTVDPAAALDGADGESAASTAAAR
ncbi:MAG: methyltransferase [Actinocatenispora sp.]